ncbi:MAG: hypothetical protein ABGX22_11135 [Pirellulaceae bacterium]
MRRITSRFLTMMLCVLSVSAVQGEDVLVGTFDIDATTPVGSPLAYDIAVGVQTPLSCRGVVIVPGDRSPIVLCALDWIGISNGGQDAFRDQIAKAVGTDPERVVVHTLHQHDAPRCDFSADALLQQQAARNEAFDPRHARDVVKRAARAAKRALDEAVVVTHFGLGVGTIEKVASNRRILGDDGKVKHIRWTATKDPIVRAFPAGTIDPKLRMVSFWAGPRAVVAITYYATHPQSYYRTGMASTDFPGLARNAREEVTKVRHVHFNGAGGNIGAGKWNDGSKENRQILADRVAAGMKEAWESTQKTEMSASSIRWRVEPAVLPAAPHLKEADLRAVVEDTKATPIDRYTAAKKLVWLRRCLAKDPINIGCLTVGDARALYMPGELFVEYQLAAQELRTDLFVAMAAYGDYGAGYIGTEIAYGQGGYETSPRASNVGPAVEKALMDAVKKLLR